jgi:hypothetical protein
VIEVGFDSGVGQYNFSPAKFTLIVKPADLSDTTPPTTTPTGIPTGWVNTNVTVTLTATDNVGGSGVDKTYYKFSPEGTANVYTAPFIVSDEGVTTVYFWSVDKAGKIEATQSALVKIDTIAPVVSDEGPSDAPWYNAPVTNTFKASDQLSGFIEKDDPYTFTVTSGANEESSAVVVRSGKVYDLAGNESNEVVKTFKIDWTAPTIAGSASPAANGDGWNNTNVTVSFNCGDTLSGVATCTEPVILSGEGAGQSVTGTAVDKAGNSASTTVSGIKIDMTAPEVSLVGGLADGTTYYFGSVPAAPTCYANDALSGVDGSCSVDGYFTTVGSHTVTASATDKAGNNATASATYEVKAWTLSGFYKPVDMGGVWNTVKGGSTVPLKFEVFVDTTELTSIGVLKSFVTKQISCDDMSIQLESPVEITTTGGTTFRYDTTASQFIQNWQTPKAPGKCYLVTMTTQDGSPLSANFKLSKTKQNPTKLLFIVEAVQSIWTASVFLYLSETANNFIDQTRP